MKKKSRKVAYSHVPAKHFVASRVKANWPGSEREFEAAWMSAYNGKSYDFSILEEGKSKKSLNGSDILDIPRRCLTP